MFVLLLTYTLLSMTDFNQLGPIVAYNAQSLRKPGRLEHILGEFQHASIVCINGTRWKAKDDIPVELYHIRGFLVYSAGYGKSSNRHEARAIQGTKKGSKRRWGNAPMTSVPTVAQNKHLLQKPAQQGGWSAQVYREDVTETKRTGVHGFTKGVLESSFGESPKGDVAEKDIDDEIGELRRTVKREKNSKVVPFWVCPMEMLKLLMHPQTVYRRVAWGLCYEKQRRPPRSFFPWLKAVLLAFRRSHQPPTQIVMSQTFNIHKKMLSHLDGEAQVGTDCRRIFAFGSFTKVWVKVVARRKKVHKPKNFDFGCVNQRSRDEAIMIQEIMAERLRLAKMQLCTKM